MERLPCRLLSRITLGLLAAAAGCAPTTAMVNGVEVARPTLRYEGDPYSIVHYHAHPAPGGASSGLFADGGWIGGRVCIDSYLYFVDHHGDHVLMQGLVNGGFPLRIEIQEHEGIRWITGGADNIWVGGDGIVGNVGGRRLRLVREQNRLVGDLGMIHMVVSGSDALWDMPAADQAAMIVGLVHCRKTTLRRVPAPSELDVHLGAG